MRILVLSVLSCALVMAACSDDTTDTPAPVIDGGSDSVEPDAGDSGPDTTTDGSVDAVEDTIEDASEDAADGEQPDGETDSETGVDGGEDGSSDVGDGGDGSDTDADAADADSDEPDESADADVDLVLPDSAELGDLDALDLLITSFRVRQARDSDRHILYIEGIDFADRDLSSVVVTLFNAGGAEILSDFVLELPDGFASWRGRNFTLNYPVFGVDTFGSAVASYEMFVADEGDHLSNTLTATIDAVGGDGDTCVPPITGTQPCGDVLACLGEAGSETCQAAPGGDPIVDSAVVTAYMVESDDCSEEFPHGMTYVATGSATSQVGISTINGNPFDVFASGPPEFSVEVPICVANYFDFDDGVEISVTDAATRESAIEILEFPGLGLDGECWPTHFGTCGAGLFCHEGACVAAPDEDGLDCDRPEAVDGLTELTDETGLTNAFEGANCLDGGAPLTDGYDHLYELSLDPSEGVTVDVDPAGLDNVAVFIVGTCSHVPETCLDAANEAGAGAENVTYMNESDATQTVWVVVDTVGAGEAATFDVTFAFFAE